MEAVFAVVERSVAESGGIPVVPVGTPGLRDFAALVQPVSGQATTHPSSPNIWELMMINRALRLAREFHRMKQVELAKRLNISTSYLSEIEAGKKPPTIELLDGYADVFGVPASTFMLFQEQMNGRDDTKRQEKARKLLQFFEWVTREEDEGGETEKAAQARKPNKAIHA